MNKNIFLLIFILFSFLSRGQESDSLKEFKGNNIPKTKIGIVNSTSAIPTNDDCSNAITLTVNAVCTNGTTDQGTLQTLEPQPPCAILTFNQSVWYTFRATATRMYVQLTLNSIIGGTMSPARWVSAVYHSNLCLPPLSSLVSCQNANTVGSGDGIIENIMNGLVVGDRYYIQVAYGIGNGFNGVPDFCIKVGDQFSPICNTCQSPCGQACGFSSTPSVTQVTTSCTAFNQLPANEGSTHINQCYTFRAVNTTVSFNIIINSTCGNTGNVSGFTYSLFSSSCGTTIQTGTLSNLTFSNLITGQWYTFCYDFNVPAGCYHIAYYPYFVGAAPLPVQLLHFDGKFEENKIVLSWSTASETNNDYFMIEKSYDGLNYFLCDKIVGSGTTSMTSNYLFCDYKISNNFIYYKLSQFDYDGVKTTFDGIIVKIPKKEKDNLKIINALGQEVSEDYEGLKFYIQK